MESAVTDNRSSDVVEVQDVKSSESVENFQKFIYELFEKNGVINDLRAHLRGHIVGVLRSAQTGDPPACYKHFTQRLELHYQALNILIVEYMMRLEFSYSLSVFISEIPLANMVFVLAKSLMQNSSNYDPGLRFVDEDVWSILNYLGIKCDSNHASNIVDMYRGDKHSPLLLCILKCVTMFKNPSCMEQGDSSQESVSSAKSSDSHEKNRAHATSHHVKCKHYVFCKTCQDRMARIKDRYKRKKNNLARNIRDSDMDSLRVESLMKNIDVVEKNLIDEMFQQLKSVYEAEVEMMKNDEEKRLKKSLATHALQLQKKRDELEESFRARELVVKRGVEEKKRFLWGVARALRDQHHSMARAMEHVRAETHRLAEKEESLKTQQAEAERFLRQRGEDMRSQISNELILLEEQLESIKTERDSINKERSELEHEKLLCENTIKSNNQQNEDMHTHYDLLKKDFLLLKEYLDTAQLKPKSLIDRCTITEFAGVTTKIESILNNEQDVGRSRSEDKVKPKQVVNDLKKQKNVNFSQSNLDEIYNSRSRSRSRSSGSSSAGDASAAPARGAARDALQRLRDDNLRLRTFATQQREHIDELSSQQARLQAELTALRAAPPAPPAPSAPRPRTAPPAHSEYYAPSPFMQRVTSSASANFGYSWRNGSGAGEELTFFNSPPPRVAAPGDAVPFIGAIRDRHTDNRRYLLSQWRSLRRGMSPGGRIAKPSDDRTRVETRERPSSAGPSIRVDPVEDSPNLEPNDDDVYQYEREQYEQQSKRAENEKRAREKSLKSMPREAKERLRTVHPLVREKSPNTVLREAKFRLRKLEIEAEAVEKSYLDFRRKQDALKNERHNLIGEENAVSTTMKDYDIKQNISYKTDEKHATESTSHYKTPPTMSNFNNYIKEYRAKYDLTETHFKNKNTTYIKAHPIPSAYTTHDTFSNKKNYLETPLAEFRKYYNSEKRVRIESTPIECPKSTETRTVDNLEHAMTLSSPILETSKVNRSKSPIVQTNESPEASSSKGTRKEVIRKAKHDKVKELEILKHNIKQIYNLPEKSLDEELTNESSNDNVENMNLTDEKIDVPELFNHNLTPSDQVAEETAVEAVSEIEIKQNTEDKNLLRIEVESVSEVNDLKVTDSQTQDLLLVVESSIDNGRKNMPSDIDFEKDMISTQMTILVSPKKSDNEDKSEKLTRGDFGEKAEEISGHDVFKDIYQADRNGDISSVQMELELSKDALDNIKIELDQNGEPDYPDDFSADVDNYNSRSDYNNSPISLPKTSEDDNFWDT